MTKEEIKELIADKGVTQRDFEAKYGFPKGSVSNVFRIGRPDVELAICEFLNLPPHKVFPERYSDDDLRLDPRSSEYNRSVRASANGNHNASQSAA